MKRTVSILSAAMLTLMVAGCTSKPKLYVYNWTYYLPQEVVRAFEKEFGVTVVYDVFASNEEMFAKLKAGGSGYDITVPSGDYVSIMIKEGMLDSIDKSRVPNFANIDTAVLRKNRFDPGSAFSVPYMMGGSGIAVNRTFVKDYPRDWSIFDQESLRGKMTVLDDMREVLGAALKSLGHSVNSVNPQEIEEAKRVVMRWKKNILKFDAESFGKGFAAGEFWVVQGYAENVFMELDSAGRAETDFFIPSGGGTAYVDNMVILKDARNKDLAYSFINYVHRPGVFAQILDSIRYPCINTAAAPLRKNTANYELEALRNSELKEDLGESLELYNKAWQEIRAGG